MKTSAQPRRRRAPATRDRIRENGVERTDTRCPVVGMGASAGGLASFESFFRAMPPRSGLAFVLIQHLDPTHASLTAELVAKHTSMPVVQLAGDTLVEPEHVYVIPPNKYLSIEGSTLRLTAPSEPRGQRMPIDLFLRSLAKARQERAVGIVLSGTGTDGALGLKEIQAAGGMTMVQEPETAQYDGMPCSAIAAGGVDYVLPIEGMPAALLTPPRHAHVGGKVVPIPVPEETTDDLDGILAILRTRSKVDFSQYKKGTLRRRIQRRMGLRHVAKIADYARIVRDDAEERSGLSKDLLIVVTSFFRDPEVWQILDREVIARIVEGKRAGQPLRIWVPGCATGEEAYSLAILFMERLDLAKKSCPLQIFASDVENDALDVGRAGLYPKSIAADISPERLRRFFVKEEHGYRVNQALRGAVIFACQNLLSDPPFSKTDLVSCRNTLMYFEAGVQEKVVALLHFSLLEHGFLVLGTAETIGGHEDLFEPVSKKYRIYRRIGPTRHDKVEFPMASEPRPSARVPLTATVTPNRLLALTQQILFDRFVPASVIINRKGEILQFSGPTRRYLDQPSGPPTQDIFAQVREGLQTKLRAAVRRAIRQNKPVTLVGTRLRRGKTLSMVKVSVEPLQGPSDVEGLLLVAFEDEPVAPSRAPSSTGKPTRGGDKTLVRQLEWDLKTARQELRNTAEQFETTNEELKASNEEVMSANEELQSTNEELQTSKEELQSLNEELNTVNAQLQSKVDEVDRTNDDLNNLLASANLATIFLDSDFRIRRFTAAVTKLFTLIPSDVGRPLSDIVQRFTDPDILTDARLVLDKLTPVRKEVRTHEGLWYMRETLPYRSRDNRIEGVVITFSDTAAGVLQESRLRAEAIVDTVHESLLVLDDSLCIVFANRAFYETFRTSPEETETRRFLALGRGEWNVPAIRTALGKILPERKPIAELELRSVFEGIGERTMQFRARPLARGGGDPDSILIAIEDITENKRHEEELREHAGQIRAIVESIVDGVITIDERGTIASLNPAAERTFGYRAAEVVGQNVSTLMPLPYRDEHGGYLARHLKTGVARLIGKGREVLGRRKDGTTFPMDLAVGEYRDKRARSFVGIVRDISERKQAEEEIRRHEVELSRALRLGVMGELAAGLAHELGQPLTAMANTLAACTATVRRGEAPPRALLPLLKEATGQAVRAGQIIRNVRDLVRKEPPRRARVDVRQLVENAMRLVHGDLTEHRIELHLALGDKPLPVRVSSIEIEQVLLNLMQNAIESIRRANRKSRRIGVSAVSTSPETVEIVVRDSGTGITDAVAHQIFEPFFTTKPNGLGMGLAICRTIVEAHGGRLSVVPVKSGPGSAIRFTIPLERQPGRSGRATKRQVR